VSRKLRSFHIISLRITATLGEYLTR
jgi:hypothetical protein